MRKALLLVCVALVGGINVQAQPEAMTDLPPLGFIYVEGGSFKMGDDISTAPDEKPVHEVTLSPFYMSNTEVTVAQFREFMGNTSYKTDAEKNGYSWAYTGKRWVEYNFANWERDVAGRKRCPHEDNHPVVHVSYNDAVAYCKWVSSKYDVNCRLPTEAEWEYAAKGGNKHQNTKFSGSDSLENVGWFIENSGDTKHPALSKMPNILGLYGMAGNVREWCYDWYAADYYKCSPPKDPMGPGKRAERVVRGGSWGHYPIGCRCTNRYVCPPNVSYANIGFRVVMTVK